jgi:hypothetical protein
MTPTPPEGYRLLTDEEKSKPLPMDGIVFGKTYTWIAATAYRDKLLPEGLRHYSYATREPLPREEKEDTVILNEIAYALESRGIVHSTNGKAIGSMIDEYEKDVATLRARVEELEKDKARYLELIYAVGNKYEGETRHETALRYIRQTEATSDDAAVAHSTP